MSNTASALPNTSTPDLSVFQTVPQYLADYTHVVDTDISPALRREIERLDSEYVAERMTCLDLHKGSQRILAMYRDEKPHTVCQDVELLAILLWTVTKRTKIGKSAKMAGQVIPYWGVDTFIYLRKIANAPHDVASISWRLASGEGFSHKFHLLTVGEIFKIVKQISQVRKDLTMRQIYEEAIPVIKSHARGRTGLFAAIYAHFNVDPELKDPRQKQGDKETEPEEIPEREIPEIPKMTPVKKKKDRVRKEMQAEQTARSGRASFAEEQQITCELRASLEKLIELRVNSFSDDNQILVQEQTLGMLDDALYYLNAACNRITAQQRRLDKMGKDVFEMETRAQYEGACQYFGYDLRPGEIVDYEVTIKSLYKQQSRDYHPDRHPEHLEKFLTLQKQNEIIVTYNERQRNKS